MVVKAGTSEPIRQATVALNGVRRNSLFAAVTDANGRFSFQSIPADAYRISTVRAGYMRGEYGQRGPNRPGVPLTLEADRDVKDVVISMTPTGAISGHVYASYGDPIGDATVEAMKYMYIDGRRVLLVDQTARTNDLGEYRLFWMQPGAYVIRAIAPEGRFMEADGPRGPVRQEGSYNSDTYLPVYFPGTIDADTASPVDLLPGANFNGVDLTLSDSGARRIRGRAINAITGRPAAAMSVILAKRNTSLASSSIRVTPVLPSGSFEIGGIVPGSYEIVAILNEGPGRLYARVPIEINRDDIENLVLMLQPAFEVSGNVSIAGPEASIDLKQVQVELFHDPYMTQIAPSPVAPDSTGRFAFRDVIPGDYRVRVTTRVDSYVSSAHFGGADILNSAVRIGPGTVQDLDLRLDPDVGVLDAIVRDEQSRPAPNALVALIPNAPSRGRMDLYRIESADATGHVRMTGLEPGEYKLFSWEYVEGGAWRDPNFIRSYEQFGTSVSIGERAHESVDLRLIPLR
jgi:hypothetical protein